jgi:hypothetical protein
LPDGAFRGFATNLLPRLPDTALALPDDFGPDLATKRDALESDRFDFEADLDVPEVFFPPEDGLARLGLFFEGFATGTPDSFHRSHPRDFQHLVCGSARDRTVSDNT